jgi:predicted enzyme related to lactoylglutathione lyase
VGLRIKYIDLDCADPYRVAAFWAAVLGYPQHPEDSPGDEECELVAPPGAGPSMLFQRVPEGKAGKNRVHLDLRAPAGGQDAEIERVLALGATVVDDRRGVPSGGWAVLADPEGNEFCIDPVPADPD